jgi:serine phosphatase RsbU (regulator of sigma subunit)
MPGSTKRDLELADQVQRSFLPTQRLTVPGYVFFDYYQPANHVGGDLYDYVRLPDGRLAIVLADVTGHGLAAAMLTAKVAAETRYYLATVPRPVDVVSRLNASLPSSLGGQRFLTLILLVLDPKTGAMTFVNAGHTCPAVRMPDGQVIEAGKEQTGLPLGVVDDYCYEQVTLTLPPGGMVLLYSDGFSEAANAQQKTFGAAAVAQTIAPIADACRAGAALVERLKEFVGSAPQNDDRCLVCFARL